MANRYIIHGAAFNGDGTTSAEATVAGGPGAWNTLTYFEGVTPAYGTLPTGSVVYVRSLDASNEPITRTFSVATTLGAIASVATTTSPVTWVIDSGIKWPGISGIITYVTSTQVAFTLRAYNNFIASDYNLILKTSLASFGNANFLALGTTSTTGIKVDNSVCTGTLGPTISLGTGTHTSLWVIAKRRGALLNNPQASNVVFINPKIELLSSLDAQPVFAGPTYGGTITIYGGVISGAGAVAGIKIYSAVSESGVFSSYGMRFPRQMTPASISVVGCAHAVFNGCDDAFGNVYVSNAFTYDSRADLYFPVLYSQLENSTGSKWSYRVYPNNTYAHVPAHVALSKTYTQPSAPKEVRLELLWPTGSGLGDPTSSTVYMTVNYLDDATGERINKTTYDPSDAALTASSAMWSTTVESLTTYGGNSFDRYMLSFTTTESIRQDSEVLVTFFLTPRSVGVDDVVFIDPDPSLL